MEAHARSPAARTRVFSLVAVVFAETGEDRVDLGARLLDALPLGQAALHEDQRCPLWMRVAPGSWSTSLWMPWKLKQSTIITGSELRFESRHHAREPGRRDARSCTSLR